MFSLIGTPINKRPVLGYRNLNLFKLFRLVHKLGGFDNVSITIKSETCSSYKNLRIKGKENGEYKLEIASFLRPNLNLKIFKNELSSLLLSLSNFHKLSES